MLLKKCLFPAAGYGTRFLPATKSVPKEMLPILDKPLIMYGAEEAYEAGIRDLAIVTGRNKQAMEDFFDLAYELEHQLSNSPKAQLLDGINRLINDCRISYTRQMQMRGLGHAILTGEPLIGHEPFAVVLADDLCIGTEQNGGILRQMTEVFLHHRCSVVAIEEVPMESVSSYGVIAGTEIEPSLYRVHDMVEKPSEDEAPSNLAIIGRYILTPDIFDIIRDTPPGKGGEIQITDALLKQARQGRVLAYRFKGQRFDCGSVKGFVDATNHFYSLK